MKYFIYFLMISALGLLVYNLTMIDFSDVLGKDSKVAVACTLASLCVIVLMLILLVSREIKKRVEA